MGQHFIKSGEWIVRQGSAVIRTDLGSCVALCLWDPERQIGGMNHYLLPGEPGSGHADPKLGCWSNRRLLESILQRGARLQDLRAAVIGGGWLDERNAAFRIGDANVLAATRLLEQHGIPIQYRRTGGAISRHVMLNVETGVVQIREIVMGSWQMQSLSGRML